MTGGRWLFRQRPESPAALDAVTRSGAWIASFVDSDRITINIVELDYT